MDNRDMESIRDVDKLDRVMERLQRHEKPAADRMDELTRDLERWGPWIVAVVLFGFGAWVLSVYINAAVLDAVEKIGGAL